MGSILSLPAPQDILNLLPFTEKQAWDIISLGGTLAQLTESFLRGHCPSTQRGDSPFPSVTEDLYGRARAQRLDLYRKHAGLYDARCRDGPPRPGCGRFAPRCWNGLLARSKEMMSEF